MSILKGIVAKMRVAQEGLHRNLDSTEEEIRDD